MGNRITVVVTSIAKPNRALRSLARGCKKHGRDFIVIGDVSSPKDFHLPFCDFYDLPRQRKSPFSYARICPERHYSRKNIGYLLAMRKGTGIIVDTDDDNLPYASFWYERKLTVNIPTITRKGWVNAYRYFTDDHVWPRGLPLNKIHTACQPYESLPAKTVRCPIQQGTVNENPDVDAVFRLIYPGKIHFREGRRVALAKGALCPFNSQNTTWWEDVFPLLYLPSYCSFRMTDIIRSFVAQRIAWENNWSVLFHEPTMWQQRNEHVLMKDFIDEIPGYLNNERMCEELDKLPIKKGAAELAGNVEICYGKLMEMGVVDKKESRLIRAWIKDLEEMDSLRECE